MSFSEQLMVKGQKYMTPEIAERVRREQEASAQAAQERREKLAQTFERELKERFLATPGATETDWQQQKASIRGDRLVTPALLRGADRLCRASASIP